MSGEGHATGSRVTLQVVSSLDGFIARKDNSVSWVVVRSVGGLDNPLVQNFFPGGIGSLPFGQSCKLKCAPTTSQRIDVFH